MVNVLIVSSEPRLVDAIRANLEADAAVRVALDAEAAQAQLFQTGFQLVFIDFESLRHEPFETFVTIDNILTKERSEATLMVRKRSETAVRFAERLNSLRRIVDLSRGRQHFDDTVRILHSKANDARRSFLDDPASSSDRLAWCEVDLPAPHEGSLLETSLARLLYTLHQRKESGVLTLKYSTHTLRFAVNQGDLVDQGKGSRADLFGAFAWSHGSYAFEPSEVSDKADPMFEIIADGCRTHTRQSKITDAMAPLMRRYPVVTNLWEERRGQLVDFQILGRVMDACDGSTTWEKALASLGSETPAGYRAAYFAVQLDLVQTVDTAGLVGIAVNYSREVRQARQKVDQAAIEKTKAFQAASGSGRTELERELGIFLKELRQSSPHEVLGVWPGCGRKVVQDRFYILVKEHHPDVYGGNTSGNVKSLAQDIFIIVKDSYQKLLNVEKEQTAAPPYGYVAKSRPKTNTALRPLRPTPGPTRDADPGPEEPVPHRPRLETPRVKAITASDFADGGAPREKTDVRSKLATLSGYKKKQQNRQRLASYSGRTRRDSQLLEESSSEVIEAALADLASQAQAASEAEEAAAAAEDQRQAKLDHLLHRAQKVGSPDGGSPAKDFFGKGYHFYREKKHKEAFHAFAKAYELEPDDASHLTFYAYTMFLADPSTRANAEKMLRNALQANNKQAAPDACLFLGLVLKSRGEIDEAYRLFKRAHKLNPLSREAERELRLAERRLEGKQKSDPASFIKSLFKK